MRDAVGIDLTNEEEDRIIRAAYEEGSSCAHNAKPLLDEVRAIFAERIIKQPGSVVDSP